MPINQNMEQILKKLNKKKKNYKKSKEKTFSYLSGIKKCSFVCAPSSASEGHEWTLKTVEARLKGDTRLNLQSDETCSMTLHSFSSFCFLDYIKSECHCYSKLVHGLFAVSVRDTRHGLLSGRGGTREIQKE